VKLYDAAISSASSRVRIALAYKGLHAERVPVGIAGPDATNRAPAYLALNPQGLVPALYTDGGVLLTQSLAIVEYLEELQPQPALLPPTPEGRARARALALAVASEIHALLTHRVAARIRAIPVAGAGDDVLGDWKRHWMEEGMAAYDAALHPDDAFSVGAAPTVADVFLYPQAVNAERAGLDLRRWPRVAGVVERLHRIPAFADNAPAPLR
jgi:maleylpyruvate isomerase